MGIEMYGAAIIYPFSLLREDTWLNLSAGCSMMTKVWCP